MGWQLNGEWTGNSLCLNQNDLSIVQNHTGWYENGKKKQELKDDDVYLNFKLFNIFQ